MRCWFLIMNLFALWSIQHLPVCSDKRKFGLVSGFALFNYLYSYKNGPGFNAFSRTFVNAKRHFAQYNYVSIRFVIIKLKSLLITSLL